MSKVSREVTTSYHPCLGCLLCVSGRTRFLNRLSGVGKELSPADGELCRGDHKHGVLGSVLRSLSRAAGRDRSSDHKSDAPSPLTLHLLGGDTSRLSFSGSMSRSTPPLGIVIADMDLDPYEGVDPCSFSRRAPSVHRPRRSIDGLEEGSLDSFPFPPPRNRAEERLKSPTPSCISWPVSVSHSDISLEVSCRQRSQEAPVLSCATVQTPEPKPFLPRCACSPETTVI